MSTTHHTIKVTIRSGGQVIAHFSCAAPVGSSCRTSCSRDCDDFTSPECGENGHDLVDYPWPDGQCNVTEWLHQSGTWEESYDGNGADVRSGPIVESWEGDYYTWDYAKETACPRQT